MIDDDITFGRRNSKYWNGISNMEKSKRKATKDDVLEMFELFNNWLNESSVTVCGPSLGANPPGDTEWRNNSGIFSATFINGKDFSDILPELKLTETKVFEDVVFILSLLTKGYQNRVSEEFIFSNASITTKSMESTIWDNYSDKEVLKDYEKISNMFPNIFNILYDNEGNKLEGGFRNICRVKTYWSKAYKQSQQKNLFGKNND